MKKSNKPISGRTPSLPCAPRATRMGTRTLLATGLVTFCAGAIAQPLPAAAPASAASAATAANTANTATAATSAPLPINGYAEMLKPTKPRNASAAAAANRPYTPIRRIDDEGQIPEIEMFVGESRVFPTPGVARIAVGNGTILTAAALDNKEVIVFANQAGTSSLFIWNADGRYQRVKVSIVPGDTTRYAREIAAFLSTIPKARASIVGPNIIVEGDELSDADMSKIDDLAKRYPQIVNFTNRVGWEQMVLLDVKVVEFPITYLRDIGLKWNATGGAAVGGIWAPGRRGSDGPYQINITTPAATAPPITSPNGGAVLIPSALNVLSVLNLGLNAQLNLLAQEGKATLLAEPQLSARNGSKASFIAGGEIPYTVQTRDGLAVLFKPYGVKLDITPKVDHRGVIRATLLAEVSSIDRSLTTIGGPALLTRRTETEFNLRDGETIVLAGLLQREVSTDIDKVPLLGDIPVLGALFRSKRYLNKETEMVVFVTPTVVSAGSAGTLDRVQRTTGRLQERMGANPYLSEPLQPGVAYERPNAVPAREPAQSVETETAPLPTPVGMSTPPRLVTATVPVAAGSAAAERAAAAARLGSTLTVVVNGVVLRTDPSVGSAALMQLDRGAIVQLGSADPRAGRDGVWRNVVLGALDGWVPVGSVQPALGRPTPGPLASPAGTAAAERDVRRPLGTPERALPKALTLSPPAANARLYKVAANGLALRITPDVNAEVVARPAAGDTVLALPHAPRGGWSAVQLGDAAAAPRGWLPSQWLVPALP